MAITIDTRNARRPGRAAVATVVRASQHARAFAAARRHSRVVGLLRILCPLTAIAMLGVYGLIVAMSWASNASKFKVGGVEITAEDLTMKDPTYFDVTSDGRYEVRAKRAVVAFSQDAPIKLIDVSGDLTQTSGVVTRLKAKHGLFENKKGELTLFDGIEIDASNGVMARLSRAMIYSKEGKVVSTEPVSATMPTGSVQAAAMTMHNKARLVEFRGDVAVRLLPQQGQAVGLGNDARQPVDIRAEEFDMDDNAKTAHFRGNVVAVQGETMLRAPYLLVKYEGRAAGGPGAGPPEGKDAGTQGTPGARVTALRVRNGVEITAGTDRRITSDLVDFDVAADTALFAGNVVATQDKNVLKGGRLLVDRKAGRSRLETPGANGRIWATFQQGGAPPARATKRQPGLEAVQETMLGSFKADRTQPMIVEADRLDIVDASSKAVFGGDVRARQGDLLLRTAELTAFYSGQTGMGFGNPADGAASKTKGPEKGEIVRLEAKRKVVMDSKDQSATAEWATFDVKGNTALLGGGVIITKASDDPLKPNTTTTERLRVDLTTGLYHFESEPPSGQRPQRPPPPVPPALSANAPATSGAALEEKMKACPPGRICSLIFPEKAREKAIETLKKRAPTVNVP